MPRNDKVFYFGVGFVGGCCIVMALAWTSVTIYRYLSYGEGLGKMKSIGRKLESLKTPNKGAAPSTVPVIEEGS